MADADYFGKKEKWISVFAMNCSKKVIAGTRYCSVNCLQTLLHAVEENNLLPNMGKASLRKQNSGS